MTFFLDKIYFYTKPNKFILMGKLHLNQCDIENFFRREKMKFCFIFNVEKNIEKDKGG